MLIPIFTLLINNDFDGRFYKYGISSALLLFFSLNLFYKKKLSSFFSVLGGYSYVMYLIHPYIFIALKKLTIYYPSNLTLIFLTIFSLFFVNLASYYLWKFVENPFTNYLRLKIIS